MPQVALLALWFTLGGHLVELAFLDWIAPRLGRGASWPWWLGGPAFVAAELLVHLAMRARGLPSFYDGRA